MRFLLLIGIFLFCTDLVWAAAGQVMQQKKQMQEAMMQKAIAEQQMAQQAVAQQVVTQQVAAQQAAMQQEFVVDQNIPVSATFTLPSQVGEVQSVVEMSDILKSLETSSKAWPLIISKEPKLFIILKYVDYFKKRGAVIRKPAEEYLDLLDSIMAENADITKNPFENVFQFVATLEYDFDNGLNKDKMIIDLIGKEGYQKNKQRLGMR